jgi:hypothetical protein
MTEDIFVEPTSRANPPDTTASVYESRLLAYVDILGWESAMKSGDGGTLKQVLHVLHQPAEAHTQTAIEYFNASTGRPINPMYQAVQVGAFSDNIANQWSRSRLI